MTNTKFRKRALLSSVAMLLVALVALGSATFAWFTSSTQATANGISVSTIKSSELVISKSDLNWNTTLNYNESSTSYTPVSTANGTAWYEAEAKDKSSYAVDSDLATPFTALASGAAENHYFTEMLNIGNAGDAEVDNVKIQITGLSSSYARLAIYEVSANVATADVNTSAGTHKTTGETFAQCIYDTEEETYNAVTGTAKTAVQSITAKDGSGTLTINVPNLAGKTSTSPTVGNKVIGGIAYYKFYIWFEGQDEDCLDANAGASFGNLTFTVSGDTATT